MSYSKMRKMLEELYAIERALNARDGQPHLEDRGTEEREAVAFVKGAKYWEYHSMGGTMWQSDQALIVQEAERRYGYNAMKGE